MSTLAYKGRDWLTDCRRNREWQLIKYTEWDEVESHLVQKINRKQSCTIYWSLYGSTYQLWKFVKNTIMQRKILHIACFCHAKGCHAPNFAEKTFAYSYKTAKFMTKVLSLKSFLLYGMRHMHMYANHFWRWSIQESLSFFFHGHINYFLQESLRFLELDIGAGQTTPTIVAQAACRHICIINSLFLSGFSVFSLLPTSSFQLWQLWQHRVFHENILFWLKIVMYIMYCCSTACLDKTLCLWSTILMIFFFLHFRCTVSMR